MEIQLPEEIIKTLQQIRSDNTSGAAELAVNAADCYKLLLSKIDPGSTDELMGSLTLTSQKLIQTQPAMAPIFNLANTILFGIDGVDEPVHMKAEVKRIVDDFVNTLKSSEEQLITNCLDIIQAKPVIMTYSFSSTVMNALIQSHDVGNNFEVICSESRPVCEGVILAKKLVDHGIKVTLVVDSALFSLIPEVDVILVGADSISMRGLVNKIGTSALAVAAQEFGVEFYSLCSSQKFLPREHQVELNDYKSPQEILAGPIANVEVKNIYFDLTPLEYLTGIVTEKGVIRADELLTKLDGPKVHSSFII
jgi:translation initiation factor 2B subunit (eIF-2B alpha/beta/delta family)